MLQKNCGKTFGKHTNSVLKIKQNRTSASSGMPMQQPRPLAVAVHNRSKVELSTSHITDSKFSGTEWCCCVVTKQRTCKVGGGSTTISEPGFCSFQRLSVLIHDALGDVGGILLGSLKDHRARVSMRNLTFSHSFC